jgi:hypothetical protein
VKNIDDIELSIIYRMHIFIFGDNDDLYMVIEWAFEKVWIEVHANFARKVKHNCGKECENKEIMPYGVM